METAPSFVNLKCNQKRQKFKNMRWLRMVLKMIRSFLALIGSLDRNLIGWKGIPMRKPLKVHITRCIQLDQPLLTEIGNFNDCKIILIKRIDLNMNAIHRVNTMVHR